MANCKHCETLRCDLAAAEAGQQAALKAAKEQCSGCKECLGEEGCYTWGIIDALEKADHSALDALLKQARREVVEQIDAEIPGVLEEYDDCYDPDDTPQHNVRNVVRAIQVWALDDAVTSLEDEYKRGLAFLESLGFDSDELEHRIRGALEQARAAGHAEAMEFWGNDAFHLCKAHGGYDAEEFYCPKCVDDIVHRFCCYLDHTTGARMSKLNYTLEAMCQEADARVSEWMDEAAERARAEERGRLSAQTIENLFNEWRDGDDGSPDYPTLGEFVAAAIRAGGEGDSNA